MSASQIALTVYPGQKAVRTLRSEAACVRALIDEIERVAPASLAEEAVSAQLVEDLARLGCRLIEAAAALRPVVDPEGPRSETRLKIEAVR
jgi:hypothetical protein